MISFATLRDFVDPAPVNWELVGPCYWPDYKRNLDCTFLRSGATTPTTYTRGPAYQGTFSYSAFDGCVLLEDEKVALVPSNQPNIQIYDSVTNTVALGPAHGEGGLAFSGGVLLTSKKVILVPFGSSYVGIYDPVANTYTRGPAHGEGASAFKGGVLLPDGRVVFVPHNSARVGIYDPVANTYTAGATHNQTNFPDGQFIGGCLLPDGRVLLVPFRCPRVCIFDPAANVVSNSWIRSATPSGSLSYGFAGAVLTRSTQSPYTNLLNYVDVTLVPSTISSLAQYEVTAGGVNPTNIANKDFVALSFGGHGENPGLGGSEAFYGGVLLPNSRVVLIPRNSRHIGIQNDVAYTRGPAHNEYDAAKTSNNLWAGGCLLPNGNVLFVPHDASYIGLFTGGTGNLDDDIKLSAYWNKL